MILGDGDSTKPIVLIVDDDPSLRLIMCSFASENGYEPIDASDADEAKILLEKNKPDIALIDAYMPGMNGFDLCLLLKENPETCDIPVIIITGLDDDKSVQEAFNCGADDFITKPIHWAVLRHRMKVLTQLKINGSNDKIKANPNMEIIVSLQKECKEQIDTILNLANIGQGSIGEVDKKHLEELFSRIEACGEELYGTVKKLVV